MKIIAVMQFYLDAELPRDPTWAAWPGFTLVASKFTAVVSPWDPFAQDLFPNEIDVSLASMSLELVPLQFRGGKLTKTVAGTVVDRIQVALQWEEPTAPDSPPLIDLSLAQGRAVDAANVLIEHLRSSARAAWVPRIRRAWRPEDGNFYILTPWTAAVFDADTRAPLPVFAGGAVAISSPGAMRAPGTGAVLLADLEKSIRLGANPALHNALLIDAETAVQSLAIREAILSMASACEVAAHAYIGAKAGTGAKAYEESLKRPSTSFAGKFYERATEHFSTRSLLKDDPSAFSLLEEMYRERNSLIHSGHLTERLADLELRERQRTVYAYLSAAGRAVDWITTLL